MAFPNVPNVPGVPPLLRDPGAAAAAVETLLTGDLVVGYGAGLAPAWGVYKGGAPIVICEAVVGLDFKREWAIADYPVEDGSFASYDKVDLPYNARVQFAAGGTKEDRQALLNSLDAIAGDLKAYDIVMPEQVYSSANVQRYDFRRTARNGVGLLLIDVMLLEIRTTAQTRYANTKSPAGSSPQQNGNVQAGDATPQQQQSGAGAK